MRPSAGNLLYAALFCIVLPALLLAWAGMGDGSMLPPAPGPAMGWALAGGGIVVWLWAAAVFIAGTGKLPVSTDRPATSISAGPYAVVPDPLYAGFGALVFGTACVLNSRFGFWIVAPAFSLATITFVLGYENVRRPPRAKPALLAWPERAERPATPRQRLAAMLNVLLLTALFLPFTGAEMSAPNTTFFLLATVSAGILSTSGGHSAGALRRSLFAFTAGLLVSTVLLAFVPGLAAYAAWIGIAVGAFANGANLVPAVLLLGAGASIMFFSEGQAAAMATGFGGAFAAALPVAHRALVRLSERIANSWGALEIGPMRIINYAAYAFLAALAGALVFQAVSPGPAWLEVLDIAVCGTLGAAIWANLIENTGRLARPFGYFGAMMGGTLGVVVAAVFTHTPLLAIAGAAALAAPWVQAIGRFRCLVQGCCHGAKSNDLPNAIVYRRTESRVVKIAGLGGVPVHPTPLFSIYGNLLLGLLLARMAWAGVPAGMLAGVYLIGAGAARFIEERFRGEPQTRIWCDLKMYQWLAVGEMLTGALVSVFASAPLAHAGPLGPGEIAVALTIAVFAGAAMGLDFPNSRLRFSRLTPK